MNSDKTQQDVLLETNFFVQRQLFGPLFLHCVCWLVSEARKLSALLLICSRVTWKHNFESSISAPLLVWFLCCGELWHSFPSTKLQINGGFFMLNNRYFFKSLHLSNCIQNVSLYVTFSALLKSVLGFTSLHFNLATNWFLKYHI